MPQYRNCRSAEPAVIKFYEENGGAALYDQGWYFFPTGARREGHSHGAIEEPPAEPLERQKRIVDYWKRHTRQAVDEFYNKRDTATQAASQYNAEDFVIDAEKAHGVVVASRQELKAAEDELLRIKLGCKTVEEALQRQVEQQEQAGRDAAKASNKSSDIRRRLKSLKV